jgi:hypothetical protein
MKLLYTIPFIFIGSTAFAQSNTLGLALPSAPQNYQSDSVRAGDLDCSNAIGSSTNLEFGVTGLIENGSYDSYNNYRGGPSVGNVGVYARITIPIGGPKERVNCNDLYQLELQRKRLEIMRLEQELQQLRELQFTSE